MVVPFRWNLAKPESLGRLIPADVPRQPSNLAEIRRVCARIVDCCDDGLLVFVGRSPEPFFDYLGGIFRGTSWHARGRMLNISMYYETVDDIRRRCPRALRAIKNHLESKGIGPSQIVKRRRPTSLVDFVASGGTLGSLTELVLHFAREDGLDTGSVKQKLRFVALVRRERGSMPWRWHTEADWPRSYPRRAVKNIALDRLFWSQLADHAAKVANHHPPQRWCDPVQQIRPRLPEKLAPLQEAVALYRVGTTRCERRKFARMLARLGMRRRWARSLVTELNHCRAPPHDNLVPTRWKIAEISVSVRE